MMHLWSHTSSNSQTKPSSCLCQLLHTDDLTGSLLYGDTEDRVIYRKNCSGPWWKLPTYTPPPTLDPDLSTALSSHTAVLPLDDCVCDRVPRHPGPLRISNLPTTLLRLLSLAFCWTPTLEFVHSRLVLLRIWFVGFSLFCCVVIFPCLGWIPGGEGRKKILFLGKPVLLIFRNIFLLCSSCKDDFA